MRMPRGWETYSAAVAGVAAAALMRPDFYKDATGELTTLLGLIMAAVIPTMLLAATALRAGNFTVLRLRSLSKAIQRLIALFGGLFIYALVGSAIVIVGKTQSWALPTVGLGGTSPLSIPLSQIFPAGITFVLIFLGLRSIAFIGGVQSIMRLVGTLAEDEAISRDRNIVSDDADELRRYSTPVGYGETVDIEH